MLNGWLTDSPLTSPVVVPNPIGAGEVSIVPLRLGLQEEVGVFVAASRRTAFPTQSEMLLLRVATNQAAIGLQEARRSREQRRAAEELEQRVVARTRQLTAVNEEFRQEIVERQRAEEQVRQSEARWRALFENSAVGITMMDLSGRFLAANAAYQAMLGYSEAELQALSFMDLTHEDDRAANWGLITELLEAEGPSFVLTKRYWHKDSHVIWGNVHVSLVPGTESIPRCIMAVVEDITERKRAEQRLVAQHTVTQILAEAVTLEDATPHILQAVCECLVWDLGTLWSLDRQAGVLRCVEVWHKAFVAAPHFAAASRASTFLPGSGLPGRVWASRAPAYIPDVVQDANFPRAPIAAREGLHTAFGFPILLGADVLGVIEFFSQEIRQPDQDLLHMMATIGSQIGQFIERTRAEEALRASEASLAEGQQISHTGNWRWNMRTGEVRGSAEHSRIFGFDPAAGPRSHLSYRERVYPDDRPALVHVLDSAIRDQCAFQHEYRIVLPDGVVKHVQLAGRPDSDASGALEFAGTIMDITERKRAEEALHNAQVELARMARLTMMGELTASITHEINQPLGAVVNNASACVRWLAAQNLEEAQRSAALVVADGHRAADIIGRIRALAQKAPPHKDWLDLNATIRDVLALARSEVHRHGVVVETHLAAEVPPILGDRIQLQQVLLNLVMNAIEAMSGVGAGPRVLRVSAEPVATTDVLIAVRDAGPGLDLQSLDRLFDAFYTTKPQGLGLGLAISRRIIEAHGGRLWATPNPGPGATFQLTLPAGGEQVS